MTAAQQRMRRVAAVGLIVYLGVAAVILLSPVSYGAVVERIGLWLSQASGVSFGSGWVEFVANIALFVPVGIFLTILFRRAWMGAVIALAGSAMVEIAQVFIPARQPSLRDVLANVLGAAVGAALAWLILRRAARRAPRADAASAPDRAG